MSSSSSRDERSVRQRGDKRSSGRGRSWVRIDHVTATSTPAPGPSETKSLSSKPLLPDIFVLLYLIFLVLIAAIALHSYQKLPDIPATPAPNEFITANARRHLNDVTSLGIRHVGSMANEVHAKNMIVQKVEEIRAAASDEVEIETSVQTASGHYHLDFLGGLTHLYENVSNVIVRFKQRGSNPSHAFMINAHYDSALGTVAASDDVVSCSIMLEVLRSFSSKPHPFLPDHAVIFLFNGAEETILQASHAFVTQHPWAKEVKAFLNLEAAGAGGKEIVFQTGPDNPWLVKAYAKSVPHPFFSVMAQEVFQSGIIPSDTDFRIFRDYGHIPGLDVAYFINGYVYHTEFDTPSRIPDGCIQRAGENVVALVKEVANSPLLVDPAEDKHGKMIFFDLLGLFSIAYPERLAIIINTFFVLLSVVTIYASIAKGKGANDGKPSLSLVVATLGVLLLSWGSAIVVNIGIGLLLQMLGRSMTWYATPNLIFFLYNWPAVLAIAGTHEFWRRKHSDAPAIVMERASLMAAQLLWTVLLALLTYLHVCTAFVFLVNVMFAVVFRRFVWGLGLKKLFDKTSATHHFFFVLSSALVTSLPLMWSVLTSASVMDMFIPLTGRAGNVVPPDLVIGILAAVLVSLSITYTLPIFVYASSSRFKRIVGGVMIASCVAAVLLAASGAFFPYAGGAEPKPKRFILQHTDRAFHDVNGNVLRSDSRVNLLFMDYLELAPIAQSAPKFREAQLAECDGVLFCGQPYYIPVIHMISNVWYLPAPSPEVQPALLVLTSVNKLDSGSRNFTFTAKLPCRATMYLAPRDGQEMTSWSLDSYVPSPGPCGADKVCHFVFYARGTGEAESTFWIELQGDSSASESVDIAIATHYLDPPHSQTEFLSSLLELVPEWASTIAWTSTYSAWIF